MGRHERFWIFCTIRRGSLVRRRIAILEQWSLVDLNPHFRGPKCRPYLFHGSVLSNCDALLRRCEFGRFRAMHAKHRLNARISPPRMPLRLQSPERSFNGNFGAFAVQRFFRYWKLAREEKSDPVRCHFKSPPDPDWHERFIATLRSRHSKIRTNIQNP